MFEFHFEPERVVVERDRATGWDDIRYEGLSPLRIGEFEGGPELPALSKLLVLPPGSQVRDVRVLLTDRVQIPGQFYPRPTRSDDIPDTIPTVPDRLYYEQGGTFPPRPEFLFANDGFRELRLGSFGAVPFEWNGGDRGLHLYRQVEVRLVLEPIPSGETLTRRLRPERRFSRDLHEVNWARSHVFNPEDLDRFYPEQSQTTRVRTYAVTETSAATGFRPTESPSLEGPPVDMVILTDDVWANGFAPDGGSVIAPFQDWADWRTVTGVPTVVRTLRWVRDRYEGVDDPEKIRNFLRDAYAQWGTDFVVLGGDVEIIPARMMGGPGSGPTGDRPSAWYYAGLDVDWNRPLTNPDAPRDGWYVSSLDATPSEYFPELWVGRIPARDSTEAAAILAKLGNYELRPDAISVEPSEAYFTRAVLAAGLTNYGGWATTDPALALDNGLYLAERIKALSLDPLSYDITRFYTALPSQANCGGSVTFPCYDDIRDYFGTYPPDQLFTAANVRAELQASPPAIFFHCEHSERHFMGGPSRDNEAMKPELSTCIAQTSCTNCPDWQNSCWGQYVASVDQVAGGLTRELMESLSTPGEYFLGFTYGSLTGAYDQDVISEHLLRDPDGGAIAICSKMESSNYRGQFETESVPIVFFQGLLGDGHSVGQSLSDAALANGNHAPAASRRYHLFGDPTTLAWTMAPDSVLIRTTMDPDTLANPDLYEFTILVKDPVTEAPIEGLRVCMSQGDDIYALGTTNAAGEVNYPSILVRDVTEPIEIWVTGRDRRPAHRQITRPNYSVIDQNPTLVYRSHSYSDSPEPGPTADFLEPGDRFTLEIDAANITVEPLPPGEARIAPTPRVRATVRFDGALDNERIYIGGGLAHP
ncbi:MAG: hypothetical protein IT349_11280, partial [Candidatus Eisenbacteria bacterium]|nr:hypothetical protein [Candidatus Eisenbacteria bacterium]